MRHTVDQTACLLAIVLTRSEQRRARISERTVKRLSRRHALRRVFIAELKEAMLDYDWVLAEVSSGGFGAIRASTLESARTITTRSQLTEDERLSIRGGAVDFDAFERELGAEADQADDID